MSKSKFDRQIRLFGIETQKKLQNLKMKITTSENFICAEIFKNLILLGIENFIIDDNVIKMYNKLIPVPYFKINENININFKGNVDIEINIDSEGEGIKVCSKCLKFDFQRKCNCNYEYKVDIPRECLLGSILVQEIIKKINGDNYKSEYKIEI